MILSAGGEVRDQTNFYARCVVIKYNLTLRQFVFSARRFRTTTSSYICQLQQGLFKHVDIQSSFLKIMLGIVLFYEYRHMHKELQVMGIHLPNHPMRLRLWIQLLPIKPLGFGP